MVFHNNNDNDNNNTNNSSNNNNNKKTSLFAATLKSCIHVYSTINITIGGLYNTRQ